VKIQSSELALSRLRFGDFDGDKYTDVFATWGSRWWVSYKGTSTWTAYANTSVTESELEFGDFDGDGRTDALRSNAP
ncbi:VCBS repeat-containing protein, partial [Candidatus Woesearchaeota archaeon]|nr:VCBS repeat-containing protein [Candidatus Woesearchaeota archaeon]